MKWWKFARRWARNLLEAAAWGIGLVLYFAAATFIVQKIMLFANLHTVLAVIGIIFVIVLTGFAAYEDH